MENPFVVAIISLLALLLTAALLRPLSNSTKIPFSVLLVVAGMGLGLIGDYWEMPWKELTDTKVFVELIMVILLPTLVFETASNLDTEQLIENYKAILYLAIPGLMISAGVITLIVGVFTDFSWPVALLMGVILSATDPVAVIEEFKRLGTPKDLTLLVEAESLFNDATTIVLIKLIVIILGTGIVLHEAIMNGISSFFIAFLGGLINGWIFGRMAYALLIRLRNDPYIEITLTLLLAYGSYLSAEYLFHSSGIISTAVASLVLARERPLPLPRRVEQYLRNFWQYLSFMATTLIFLMVGLVIETDVILQGIDVALIVIVAMFVSRSLVVYGLMPVAGQLRRHPAKVQMAYRHVLTWGGLRGAVTLALAMGLSNQPGAENLLSVVLIAVLFTILVQGLTIGRLTRLLQLDQPDASDRIAHAESWLSSKNYARKQLTELEQTPFAKTGAVEKYNHGLDDEIITLRHQMKHWRTVEEGPIGEWKRLLMKGLSLEVSYVYQVFDQGLLPAKSYIRLKRSLFEQIESLRHEYPQPDFVLIKRLPVFWRKIVSHLPFSRSPEVIAAEEYITAWTRRLSCGYARLKLESLMDIDETDPSVRAYVMKFYSGWSESAKQLIQKIEHQYPQVCTAQQQQLVHRLALTAQIQDLKLQAQAGLLTEGEAESMIRLLSAQLEKIESI